MKTRTVLLVTLMIAVFASFASSQTLVSFEGITNVVDDSVLSGGALHTVTIRYNLTGASPVQSFLASNAFKIYSPDGANWGSVQGTIESGFAGLDWDDTFVNHYTKTGGTGAWGQPQAVAGGNTTGNDTAVVQLAGVNSDPGGGMPGGFNDIALTFDFSSDRADAGLHICIDTCTDVRGGWEWAHPEQLLVPDWGGEICFVVTCCFGIVGDVNGEGGDEPTIGDITTLVDFLFITETQPDCLEEADVNLSGTLDNPPLTWEDVTIGDISTLVDHLFITKAPLGNCP